MHKTHYAGNDKSAEQAKDDGQAQFPHPSLAMVISATGMRMFHLIFPNGFL
jgi:hypothetical protein